jgi:hypothetical protein
MSALTRRVIKIEEALARKKAREPRTVIVEGGQVSATITPGRGGRPPCAVIHFDSLALNTEEARALIAPQIPAEASIFIFPNILSQEQWAGKYGNRR